MTCFRCNKTAIFIFLLKYCQRKVELNASEKSLVFVIIRHRKSRLHVQLSYTKISFLRENTHLRKDVTFLHFRLKESSKNDIYVKRKHTKTNENMIFPVLLTSFRKTKILFFMQCYVHIFEVYIV